MSAFLVSCDGWDTGIIYAEGKKAARRKAIDIVSGYCEIPRDLANKEIRCVPASEHDEGMNANFGWGVV